MKWTVSMRVLAGAVLALSVIYIVQLMHGGHSHSGSSLVHHHHHHDHEHIEYQPVLGVKPTDITFLEAVYPEGGWLVRVEGSEVSLYEGALHCDGSGYAHEPSQIAIRQDQQLFTRWQTFFSNMTPDAHIEPEAIAETYGLDQPIGCMRIGVMREGGREEVVFIQFGDLNVAGLNQYITVNFREEVLLIPRYFWQQVRLQMP